MRLAHSKKRGSRGTVIQLGSPHRNLMGRDAATSHWIGAMPAATRGAAQCAGLCPMQKGQDAPFCAEHEEPTEGYPGRKGRTVLACRSRAEIWPTPHRQIPSNARRRISGGNVRDRKCCSKSDHEQFCSAGLYRN